MRRRPRTSRPSSTATAATLSKARYYLRENFDVLVDSLLRAWAVHGASRELYLDNAKIYHARALKAACFALNIRLLHRGVGDPPPGGLIERFIETTQGQFESEVRAGDILTLDRLNHALAAWLEQGYHRQPNSETHQTPLERYQQANRFTRHVNLQEVLKYFLERTPRKVHPDFSDVQLDGMFFQVDPRLRGDRVEVRYDPFSPPGNRTLVLAGRRVLGGGQTATSGRTCRSNRRSNNQRPNRSTTTSNCCREARTDAARPARRDRLPGGAGCGSAPLAVLRVRQTIGRLSGPKGGLAAFTTDELESLQKSTSGSPAWMRPCSAKHVNMPRGATIPDVVFRLQQLAHEKQRRT